MNDLKIEDMIYVTNGVHVMPAFELSMTKCHDCPYNKIVTYYDINKSISVFINFADASAKMGRC